MRQSIPDLGGKGRLDGTEKVQDSSLTSSICSLWLIELRRTELRALGTRYMTTFRIHQNVKSGSQTDTRILKAIEHKSRV